MLHLMWYVTVGVFQKPYIDSLMTSFIVYLYPYARKASRNERGLRSNSKANIKQYY